MMKTNYKYTAAAFIAVTFLFGGFFVANAATTPTERQAQYCQNFIKNAEVISRSVKTSASNLAEREESRSQRLQADRERRTQQLIVAKEKAKERREAMYERLLSYANTDVKKEALEEFKAKTEESVKKREAAVDAEIERIRKSADEGPQSYDTSKLNDALKSAVESAKDQCENGGEVSEVRRDFMAKINDIRKTFQGGNSPSALITTKTSKVLTAAQQAKETTKVAENEFKASVQTTTQATQGAYTSTNASSSANLSKPSLSVSATSLNKGDVLTVSYDTGGHPGCKIYEPNLDGTPQEGGGWYTREVTGELNTPFWNDSRMYGLKCSDGAKADQVYTVTAKTSSSLSGDFSKNSSASVSVNNSSVKNGDTVTVTYDPGSNKACNLLIYEVNPYKITYYNDSGFSTAGTYRWAPSKTSDVELNCNGVVAKTRVTVQ